MSAGNGNSVGVERDEPAASGTASSIAATHARSTALPPRLNTRAPCRRAAAREDERPGDVLGVLEQRAARRTRSGTACPGRRRRSPPSGCWSCPGRGPPRRPSSAAARRWGRRSRASRRGRCPRWRACTRRSGCPGAPRRPPRAGRVPGRRRTARTSRSNRCRRPAPCRRAAPPDGLEDVDRADDVDQRARAADRPGRTGPGARRGG